jgi:hypothetical protein
MSDRNGRYLAALRGLALSVAAIAVVIVAVLIWNQRAALTALRERGYPVPATSCNPHKDCDEKALKVQARAAVTADAAFDVALGQLVTSVIGFFGIMYTVFYARLAWKEAERSANVAHEALGDARAGAAEQANRFTAQLKLTQKAADSSAESAAAMRSVAASMATNVAQIIQSVEISKQVARSQRLFGQTQLRAYVSVLIGGATYQERSRNWKFDARPTLSNTGHTPARNLRWRARAAILPVPLPDDFKFPIPAHGAGGALLTPQQTADMLAVVDDFVDDADIADIKRGNGRALYVWGYLIYQDIFRRTHRTTFAQQLHWVQSGPETPNGEIPEIIRGWYLPKHNKAN